MGGGGSWPGDAEELAGAGVAGTRPTPAQVERLTEKVGGPAGPDPRDVALHGHPGDATSGPEPGPPTAEHVAAALATVGVRLHPRQCQLIAAWAVGDPGPPWPVGTVLVPPDPDDPRVWLVADDDDDPFFGVDPWAGEGRYGWDPGHDLPERPVVLRRGPEAAL